MILKQHIVFTGTVHNMTAYFAKSGQCIVRMKSSITGARIAKDPAFEGFRQSSIRMKDASPIAAELYNQLPAERKDFKLFRILTGAALKLLKEGFEKQAIIKKLQDEYIHPVKNRRTRIRSRKRVLQVAGATAQSLDIAEKRSIYSGREGAEVNSLEKIPRHPHIYLGRNRQYRKFKIWLQPACKDDDGFYSLLYRHKIGTARNK